MSIESASCAALLEGFLEDPPQDVNVKWDGENKSFDLQLEIQDANTGKILNDYTKRIPVEIAEASKCDCGGSLTLGNYSITSDGSDFLFKGEYYCNSCRTKKIAEQSGFRHLLSKWMSDVTSIKLGMDGAEISLANKP